MQHGAQTPVTNAFVLVQEADFNVQQEVDKLRGQDHSQGALVTFTGLVRDNSQSARIRQLYLEHYPAMTQACLEKIAHAAIDRWRLGGATIIHRVGYLDVNEQIVFVGATAAHRHDAFQACEFMMDYLKTQAPFWKKEITEKGEFWVQARQSDAEAHLRWQN